MKRIITVFSFLTLICLISLAQPSDVNGQQNEEKDIIEIPQYQYDNEDIVSEVGAAFTAEEVRRGKALTKLSTFNYNGKKLTQGIDWSPLKMLVYINGIPYQFDRDLPKHYQSEAIRSLDESVWYFYEDLYRGDTISVIVGIILSLIPLVLLTLLFYFTYLWYTGMSVEEFTYKFNQIKPQVDEGIARIKENLAT